MYVCAHTVCQNRHIHHVWIARFWRIWTPFSIHVCLIEMYVYFISQMRIHLSYWGTHKKWCMEIGFYIFYICSLKHTFDIRVFIIHHKNLRKPAEIWHFLTNQFITVNKTVSFCRVWYRLKTAEICDKTPISLIFSIHKNW